MDLLERLLDNINKNRRKPVNRITYNIVSSTQATEYIRAQTTNQGDCDCLILISLCYGRQTVITEDLAKTSKQNTDRQGNYKGPSLDNEIILADLVLPKHLIVVLSSCACSSKCST